MNATSISLKIKLATLVLSLAACGGVAESPLQSKQDGSLANTSGTSQAIGLIPDTGEGHILCISGQADNVIRVIRPGAAITAFPASYYLQEGEFPITDIADLSTVSASADSITVVFSANGASPEFFAQRYLYSAVIDLRKRSYILRQLSSYVSKMEAVEIRRNHTILGQAAPLSVSMGNGKFLSPVRKDGKSVWAINDGNESTLTNFAYPEFSNPQYLAAVHILSFQTIQAGRVQKKFYQLHADTNSWLDITARAAANTPAQFGGGALPNANGFWWLEQSDAGYQLAAFKVGSTKMHYASLPLKSTEQISAQPLALEPIASGYKVTLLVNASNSYELREYDWNHETGIATQTNAVSFQQRRISPNLARAPLDLFSTRQYFFSHEETGVGEEAILRYSRKTGTWDRLTRSSCSLTAYAALSAQ